MKITSLRLRDFRSYAQLNLLPPDGVTVFTGENGTGKTNILEAVHVCCLGRSHRTSQDRDLIKQGKETAAAELTVESRFGQDKVGVRFFRDGSRRKTYFINGKTASRAADILGQAACVIFSPEDLYLIKGAPENRRRFLDMLLSQQKKVYFSALQQYHAALKQRNALLRQEDTRTLDAWDETLAENGAILLKERRENIEKMQTLASGHYARISGREEEKLHLAYAGLEDENLAEALLRGLAQSRGEDLRRHTTTFGPHRDDLIITLSGRDSRAFASQGQARTAALSLKLSAFDLLKESRGEYPLLLLDDVLSELDAARRRSLLEHISGVQTFLTCTDLSDLTGAQPACIYQLKKDEPLSQIFP